MKPNFYHVEKSTVYTAIPATTLTGKPTWQNGVWFQVYCHPDTGLDRETVAADIAARLNEPPAGAVAALVAAADDVLEQVSRTDAGQWNDAESLKDHIAHILRAAMAPFTPDPGPVSPPVVEGPTITLHFTPQKWVDDDAIEADPQGPVTWEVPTKEILAKFPTEEAWETQHENRDQMKDSPGAPQWVRDWSGPFEVVFADVWANPWCEDPAPVSPPAPERKPYGYAVKANTKGYLAVQGREMWFESEPVGWALFLTEDHARAMLEENHSAIGTAPHEGGEIVPVYRPSDDIARDILNPL